VAHQPAVDVKAIAYLRLHATQGRSHSPVGFYSVGVISEILARVDGVCGELVLRRVGGQYEIIANGVFLMDTRNGESERLLVRAAVERMPAGGSLLIGGLGVGFSLREALADARVGKVVVVEREQAVIDWNRDILGNSEPLDDPRVEVVCADLLAWLPAAGQFDALCLDIDNGPEWTVSEGNAALYGPSGLGMLADAMTSESVLAIWSAGTADAFVARVAERIGPVETLRVPVPRGEPDLIFLVRPR
jgi:spermidine synthase